MSITQAEQALLALIQPLALDAKYSCELWPDSLDSRGKAWQKAMLLIAFAGQSLSAPSESAKLTPGCIQLNQISTYSFELLLHAQNLRSNAANGGAYEFMQSLLEQCSGKRLLQKSGPLWFNDISFTRIEDSKFWLWTMKASFSEATQLGDCIC